MEPFFHNFDSNDSCRLIVPVPQVSRLISLFLKLDTPVLGTDNNNNNNNYNYYNNYNYVAELMVRPRPP